MSRPIIENLRTWPRNLCRLQGGGLSTLRYGELSTYKVVAYLFLQLMYITVIFQLGLFSY